MTQWSTSTARSSFGELFAAAGCDGWLHACDVDGQHEVAFGADEPVVAASVFKIAVALEFFRQAAVGELDARERVRVDPAASIGAPAGLSVFADEVEVSLRDLATSMITVSDALATDVLLERVGVERVNELLRGIGLPRTVVVEGVQAMCDGLASDCGFADWAAFTGHAWDEADSGEVSRALDLMRASRQSDPERANRTTARETTTLLRAIWRDEAAPSEACRSVRLVMGKQLQRERLARAFQEQDVRFSGKTGSFAGAFRNEAGVFELPDGGRYAVAAFTRAHDLYERKRDIDDAIGAVARLAVDELRAG